MTLNEGVKRAAVAEEDWKRREAAAPRRVSSAAQGVAGSRHISIGPS
jgi:hypothetical protein